MYDEKTVSVVMPAYNEEKGIARCIADFKALGLADEIIVVDNNSKDNTSRIANEAGANVVVETKQGYGNAIARGLREAKGDIIVVVEPDNTFESRDVLKLLSYVDDVDLVLGSRTYKRFIRKGAKMNFFLRYGNIVLAKLLAMQFHENLTDVGCTYRAIRREALENIMDRLRVGGSHFSPHMIMEALKAGLTLVEIPVNYGARTGESKITKNFVKSSKLGLRMLVLILSHGLLA